MFHFWRCIVFSALAMDAVIGEDGSQASSTAAPPSKLANAASSIASPTTQDGQSSRNSLLHSTTLEPGHSNVKGKTDAQPISGSTAEGAPSTAHEDGQSSRSPLPHSATVEEGHSNLKGKTEPQPIAGSTAEGAPSTAHEAQGTEAASSQQVVASEEAADGDIEVQKVSDDDDIPKVHSTSEFSPRCLAIIGALVSFLGVVSYSFVVLYYVFKGRIGTKLQKPLRKVLEIKRCSQLEDLENAYDMDDWGNEHAPSGSVTRKSIQSQSTEAEEDPSGWETDAASDAGWQNDSWCNEDWSDTEVGEKCQPIGDDILEAAIVAGRTAKPSPNGASPKGKAD